MQQVVREFLQGLQPADRRLIRFSLRSCWIESATCAATHAALVAWWGYRPLAHIEPRCPPTLVQLETMAGSL